MATETKHHKWASWLNSRPAGTFNQQCDIDPNVWSAAHAVGASNISAITEKILDNFPHGCLPDVPGGLGCPLYKCGSTDEASCSPDNDPPPKPPKSVCDAVCAEYEGCLSPEGVEVSILNYSPDFLFIE